MSARVFKGGPQVAVAFAPFTIPVKAEPVVEEIIEEQSPEFEGELPPEPPEPQIDFAELERQAQEIIAIAQTQAQEMVATAHAQVAQIATEAYEKGLAEARAQVDEEVNAAVAELREKLTHTVSELEPLYALIAARAERDLVKLALEIARKVIHREVTSDFDIVLTLARVALERLHPRAIAKVLLHPDDLEYVKTHRHELSHSSALEFIADLSVGRGGCIIQSEHGDIDARIEQQFASIERGFFQ